MALYGQMLSAAMKQASLGAVSETCIRRGVGSVKQHGCTLLEPIYSQEEVSAGKKAVLCRAGNFVGRLHDTQPPLVHLAVIRNPHDTMVSLQPA